MNYFLKLTRVSDGLALSGAKPTILYSLDGSVFGTCSNPVEEVGDGIYKLDLTDKETDGYNITICCIAPGANQVVVSMILKAKIKNLLISNLITDLKSLSPQDDPLPLIWILADALEEEGAQPFWACKLHEAEVKLVPDGWQGKYGFDTSIHKTQKHAWAWLKTAVLTQFSDFDLV